MNRKRQLVILAIMVVFLILSAAAASFKIRSDQKALNEHLSRAVELEKSGQLDKALEEYEAALKLSERAAPEEKKKLEQKITSLKEKISTGSDSGSKESGKDSQDGAASGDAESSTASVVVAGPEVVNIENLGSLLPEKFLDMKGTVVSNRDVASVRFDDVAARTSYFAYVYRHPDKNSAENFLKVAREKLFPVNQSTVDLKGPYQGLTGFYGEKDEGDAALYFAYGNLVFELLLKTETMERSEKLSMLLKLSEELKKP